MVINSTIRNNTSYSEGGGIYIEDANFQLINGTIRNNVSHTNGGGISSRQHSDILLINSIINSNTASYGGGINIFNTARFRMFNITLVKNHADKYGGGIYNVLSSASVFNSIMWNNTTGVNELSNLYTSGNSVTQISYSLLQGDSTTWSWGTDSTGMDQGGNIITETSPFLDEDKDNFTLSASSAAINAGSNQLYTNAYANADLQNDKDLGNNPRLFGDNIDMGAYEFQGEASGIHPDANGILYVDSAIATPGNGSSWAKALKYLSDATQAANEDSITLKIKEIHVARGTYYPTGAQSGTNKDSSFALLRGGLKLLGGYPTGGGVRNSKANPTVLSGDISSGDPANNSDQIMVISHIASTADSLVVEGFTLTRATGRGGIGKGAGLYMSDVANGSGTRISDCRFFENWVESKGGGIYIANSSPLISHCFFAENYSYSDGGGIFLAASSATIMNCTFERNVAYRSCGEIYIQNGSPAIMNCTISGGYDRTHAGAIHLQGASPQIINCLISGNHGGGIGIDDGASLRITNCTVYGNAWGIEDNSSIKSTIANAVIYHNGSGLTGDDISSLKASYSLVQGMAADPADHNLDGTLYPMFADTANGDFSLVSCSPVINKGSNRLYTDAKGDLQQDKDLDNDPRLFGKIIDMGAYEFQAQPAPPTVISAQPADTTVCGREASFSISATGYRLSYQWQSSVDNGKTWNNVEHGTAETFKLSNIQTSDSGTRYRVILTSGCGKQDTSASATLSVGTNPVITSQPQDQTVFEGSRASFSVISADATGYQWQVSADKEASWNNVTGGTGPTLNLSNVQTADNGNQYRVIVTAGCGNVISASAALTVRESGSCITITGAPHHQTVCAGSDVSFSINAAGATGYQWQSTTDGTTWNNITGETSETLKLSNVLAADNGNQYRVVIYSDCGSITSGPAVLTVRPKVKITAQPKNQTVCEGGSTVFSVKAQGASLKYQWQSSKNGTTWSNITGGTAETLELSNIQPSANDTKYHVVISSACGNVTSGSATLTVHAAGHTRLNEAICASSTYPFGGKNISQSGTYTDTLHSATGCDSIVVLHLTVRPAIKITLNKTICEGDAYPVGDHQYAQPGTYTDTLHTANGCDSVVVLHLSVHAKTAITAQPQDQTICAGGNASFSIKADGAHLKYQWQSSKDGTAWDNINGETDQALRLSGLTASDNGTRYRVIVNGSCANITSDAATLTVSPLPEITITADASNPVSKGAVVHLTASGADRYQWANGPGIQDGWNEATLTIRPQQDATYTVTGATTAGCNAQANYAVTIVADYRFRVHNIVSPNGDGKNDTWIIENIDSYPDNEVEIFDRSGRMIYHQKNYHNQWNGMLLGGPLQEGTYYYILTIDGEKKLFKGFIELLRDQ